MKTSSNRILTVAVILLLLVNVTMLFFMLKHRDHRPGKADNNNDPFQMMVKELNMTDQQQADFKKMKEAHFAAIRPVFDSVRTLRKSLFGLIKAENVNDSLISKYSSLISEQHAIADKLTINHFRNVRALFNGDQQKQFDDFIQKMMQRRMARSGNHSNDSTGKTY